MSYQSMIFGMKNITTGQNYSVNVGGQTQIQYAIGDQVQFIVSAAAPNGKFVFQDSASPNGPWNYVETILTDGLGNWIGSVTIVPSLPSANPYFRIVPSS